MQRFPLGRQLLQQAGNVVVADQALGIDDLDLVGAIQLLNLPSLRQRGDGLQSPLLVRNAPEGVVPVVDDLLLPALVLLFPSRPDLSGSALDPL